MLYSGAVAIVARVTIFSALQSAVFVALGAWQGLIALGLALIVSSAVSAAIWLRATARYLGLPLRGLLRTLRQSAAVAMLSAIGPAFALWMYGPYPDGIVMPLVLGGVGGLVGFVAGIMIIHHPLEEEIMTIWSSKIKQQAA